MTPKEKMIYLTPYIIGGIRANIRGNVKPEIIQRESEIVKRRTVFFILCELPFGRKLVLAPNGLRVLSGTNSKGDYVFESNLLYGRNSLNPRDRELYALARDYVLQHYPKEG